MQMDEYARTEGGVGWRWPTCALTAFSASPRTPCRDGLERARLADDASLGDLRTEASKITGVDASDVVLSLDPKLVRAHSAKTKGAWVAVLGVCFTGMDAARGFCLVGSSFCAFCMRDAAFSPSTAFSPRLLPLPALSHLLLFLPAHFLLVVCLSLPSPLFPSSPSPLFSCS